MRTILRPNISHQPSHQDSQGPRSVLDEAYKLRASPHLTSAQSQRTHLFPPTSKMADSKTLTAACHCQSIQFSITIPAVALPLKVHICHCSVCRYIHGTPCILHAPLPAGVVPQFIVHSSVDKLTPYNHAESQGTSYFCSTCGCHIGDKSHDDGGWVISTAIFSEPNQGIWEMRSHALQTPHLMEGFRQCSRILVIANLMLLNPRRHWMIASHETASEQAQSKTRVKNCAVDVTAVAFRSLSPVLETNSSLVLRARDGFCQETRSSGLRFLISVMTVVWSIARML